MQKPILPAWPSVARSSLPGKPPPVRLISSRSARPIVRFARRPGPSAPIELLRPSECRAGAVEDHQLSCRLRRDGLTVEIEGRLERRLHGGDDDREVLGPAAGEHRTRRDPLERRLAHRRRHLSQRERGIAAAQHRVDALAGRRDHRQPVAPAALEHVLELVVRPGGVERRQRLGVIRALGRAARLAHRMLAGHPHSRRSRQRRRLPQQVVESFAVPADDTPQQAALGIEQQRGRDALQLRTSATAHTAPARSAPCRESPLPAPSAPPPRAGLRRSR